ncbi:DUF5708 family protein [Krasilnikovia sp. M28-CT-15]|uniref:DUF5708 family protein n=1 Tax=Krasilnikovia sp. M28-CT-15 TaxID=3373540 RepID=UPI0038768EAD
MSAMGKNLATGSATFVVGLLLWRYAGDIEIPVFTLTKVGVVLMVIGALEVGYGIFLAARGTGTANR